MKSQISQLERDLEAARESSASSQGELQQRLKQLQEELERVRQDAQQQLRDLEQKLNFDHEQAIAQLKAKYERMIEELKRNSDSDKEFVQKELQKRIEELEY